MFPTMVAQPAGAGASALLSKRAVGLLAGWFVALVATSAFAQVSSDVLESGIVGRIVAADSQSPIPFAKLQYSPADATAGSPESTPESAESAGDGSFDIRLKPGVYRILVTANAYASLEFSEVVVSESELTPLDCELTPIPAGRDEVLEVTAKAVRSSDAALLADRSEAVALSDGIGAEEIKRSTDSNAAEVVSRVTGLSVVGGGYVFVRGLGERYSATHINGNAVGSPEPNKRVVPLDLFPSKLLDKIVVSKTYTPDQPGEFAGGIVDISTTDFPSEQTWNFSVAGGENETTNGKDFPTYQGGKDDYWGFADATRDLPNIIETESPVAVVKLGGRFGGLTAEEITRYGRSFNPIWGVEQENPRPAHNYSGAYGNKVEVLGRDLGFQGSFALKRSFDRTDFEERFYDSLSEDDVLSTRTDYAGTKGTASTLWGSLFNVGYRVSDNHTLNIRTLYTRSADDEVLRYEGENNNTDAPTRVTRLKYVERGLLVASGGMTHEFPALGGAKLEWNTNYSWASRNEPDRREYVYERFAGGPWAISHRTASQGFTRLYQYMDDYDRGAKADFSVPFGFFGREATFKTGGLMKNKDRDSRMRRFAFKTPTLTDSLNVPSVPEGEDPLTGPPEELMALENIGGSSRYFFTLDELTRSTDSYRAKQDMHAEYGMLELPFTSRLRVMAGARVETSDFQVITASPFVVEDSAAVARLDETDVLPAASATYALGDRTNLRAAYSRTIARPDIRELTPFSLTDFVSGYEQYGNPNLRQTGIANYDLRAEMFPSPGEVIAMSAFYKDFEDAIETSIQNTSTQLAQVPVNADSANLYGLEFEARFLLGRFLQTLDNFSVNSNLTLVKSSAKIRDVELLTGETLQGDTADDRPLQGQSPYVLNAGLFYATDQLSSSVSLLYNVFGRRLRNVGLGDVPDVYEQPRHTLDLAATQRLGHASIKLSLENVLNDDELYEQSVGSEDFVTGRYEIGRSISLAVSYGS